ncbi:MAG TPA: sigma-70 family RNA polymerase sigma factor [Blastocatellia bacterium]|nr:sigma-70 family RNA polymerase sigma factor [Blastocatellia bacterium]
MDDQAALQACRTGDRQAFRYLVETYQRQAIGHATGILANREDALDAVQEAFMDAFQALKRFDPSRKFYPWFYVILRNRCYKLAAARSKHETESIEDMQILEPSTSVPREELMLLERALMELDAEDREIITLKHLDGLSYQELAERLQIPEGTVMSRLFHARKRLHARMTRTSSKSYEGFKQ